MYKIINNVTNEIHHFTKVTDAVKYTKTLREDKSNVTKDEIRDLCNTFAKYRNTIVINGIRK